MSQIIRLSHRAEDDLEELFLYYLLNGGETPAAQFLEAFDEVRRLLVDYPEIGVVRPWTDPRLRGIHTLPMKRPFRNILILYEPTAEGVYIVRVVHGARQLEDHLTDENTG